MGRLLLVASLAVVLGSAAASGGASGQAVGKIAYSGQGGIWLVNADGSGLRALTHGISDHWPVWSADGRQIAWERTLECPDGDFDCYAIWLVRANGTKAHRLTRSGSGLLTEQAPNWSPSSPRIAFERGSDIYVVNADGTGLRRVVGDGGEPSWSPDGHTIAFSRPPGLRYAPNRDSFVYVIDTSGGTAKRLRQGAGPVWSPNGRMILFARANAKLEESLYVMNADGSAVRRLTRAGYGSWSPDSRKVAFSCGSDICAIRADGGGMQRLTHKLWSSEYPAWSPDGKWIAFVSYPGKDAMPGIYVMRADGSGIRKITPYSNAGAPAWQPGRS
jgi:TolB protein